MVVVRALGGGSVVHARDGRRIAVGAAARQVVARIGGLDFVAARTYFGGSEAFVRGAAVERISAVGGSLALRIQGGHALNVASAADVALALAA